MRKRKMSRAVLQDNKKNKYILNREGAKDAKKSIRMKLISFALFAPLR